MSEPDGLVVEELDGRALPNRPEAATRLAASSRLASCVTIRCGSTPLRTRSTSVDREVLPFDIAELAKPLLKGDVKRRRTRRVQVDHPDVKHSGRLRRPGRKQRRQGDPDQQGDHEPTPHSITSSARAMIDCGTVRPSALVDDELEGGRLLDRQVGGARYLLRAARNSDARQRGEQPPAALGIVPHAGGSLCRPDHDRSSPAR